jgi:hypothetical protein
LEIFTAQLIVDPLAKIADNVEIGPFSIIHANVVLASGHKIVSCCELATESSLSDGTPLGSPVENIFNDSKIRLLDGTQRPAYPWTSHFSRGYTEDIVNARSSQNDK